MRKYDDAYRDKLAWLEEKLGTGYTTVPVVAQYILHVDAGTLRAIESFPVVFIGSRRKVPIDRLARWLTDLDYQKIQI